MNPQTRMLIVLGVFGLGGVIALMAMANRYVKILKPEALPTAATSPRPAPDTAFGSLMGAGAPDGRDWSPSDAQARVDAFVAVRRILKSEADRPERGTTEADLAILRALRDSAARRAGLPPEVYAFVRSRYAHWKAGSLPAAGEAFGAAFDKRKEELTRLDLGPYERFDL